MNDIISIIIPTYNRSQTLPKTIQSVLNQTVDNWELIIVDDGSDDDTPKVLENFSKYSSLKYFYQQNLGVSAARNSGLKLAKGAYVIFLDSDDFFDKELLENVNQELASEPDLVCWEVTKFINGRKTIWRPKKLNGIYHYITASFLAGSVCYRRSLLLEVGGYDIALSFGENYELGQRISAKPDLKIKIINKPLLCYVLNTSTRKSNSIENRLSSYIYLYKKHRNKYDKNPKVSAEMNYLIGFVLEKTNRKKAAYKRFKKSWLDNPWNPKPLVKILYLKIKS